jgi:hypothetical protein
MSNFYYLNLQKVKLVAPQNICLLKEAANFNKAITIKSINSLVIEINELSHTTRLNAY